MPHSARPASMIAASQYEGWKRGRAFGAGVWMTLVMSAPGSAGTTHEQDRLLVTDGGRAVARGACT